jgi:hypothetical protein
MFKFSPQFGKYLGGATALAALFVAAYLHWISPWMVAACAPAVVGFAIAIESLCRDRPR